MGYSQVIIGLRATVFIPRFIGYTERNKSLYSGLVTGGKTEEINMNGNQSFGNTAWQVTNGARKLVFMPNRVDLVSSEVSEKDHSETDFLSTASNVFSSILAQEDVKAFRFAYGVTLALDNTQGTAPSEFFSRLVSPLSFRGMQPARHGLSTMFADKVCLKGKDVDMFFNINFNPGRRLMDNVPQGNELIITEIDINSSPGKDCAYQADVLEDFFSQASAYRTGLINAFMP